MTKQILITGLDGSGKSTILEQLEHDNEGLYGIIYLPHVKPSTLEGNEQLKKAGELINTMSHQADQDQLPQLKAVALFASMLLFSDIVQLKESENFDYIICERHPLIDAGVYARFYCNKLKENRIPKEVCTALETKYANEFEYILGKVTPTTNTGGYILQLMAILYEWFEVEEKYEIHWLEQLFSAKLPQEIYYLKADAKTLFSRLSGRKTFEAHENEEVLHRLGSAYDTIFSNLKEKVNIHIVNATKFENLNAFKIELVESLKLKHV